MTEQTNLPLAPEDLQLLQEVYDEVRGTRNLDQVESELVASELVQLYQLGVREEEQLKALIS
jgi:cellobiose phosphorylase